MSSDCATDQACVTSMLPAGKCVMKPDAGVDASTDAIADARPDRTTSSDTGADATSDGGRFLDGPPIEGAVADNGNIGGGGCACDAVGQPRKSEDSESSAAFAAILALAAFAERRRRHTSGS